MMQDEGNPSNRAMQESHFTEAFPETGQAVEGRAITGNLVAFRNYPGVILESFEGFAVRKMTHRNEWIGVLFALSFWLHYESRVLMYHQHVG